jgi:glutaredoxin-related protein
MKIYGSMMCPDCVQCRQELDAKGVAYDYLDFSEHLSNLKEFLILRDQEPCFAEIRKTGKIGIPCLVLDSGEVLLDWAPLLNKDM